MADFSIIIQQPEIRAIVQQNLLERAFHDALFPRLLFRIEATPVKWPSGVGDAMVFSAPGLLAPNAQPLVPGSDPSPMTLTYEQWEAQLNQYAGTIDTNMPTDMVAIASLFLRNAHQLGMQSGQTLNRIVRNKMYNAAESGWGVVDGPFVGVSTIRVKRLNGFTRARRPDLAAGSKVKFDFVSSSNPLKVTIFDNGAEAQNTVVGFTADTPGDEVGPGTLTLGANVTNVADRAYMFSADKSYITRSGGGNAVDAIGASDKPTLADVRDITSTMYQNNVPEHADGRYHSHIGPLSVSRIFEDTEFQRLMTSLPDYYAYRQFALGELLNVVFLRNNECPNKDTVLGGASATFSQQDPFAGELFSNGATTGTQVGRILFSGQGGIMEYFTDYGALVTEAGLAGKVADARVSNNGIEVNTDRIQLVIRQPLNRLQDQVAVTWRFIGDWPVRTDAATGGPARYKRFGVIQHAL